MNEYAGRAREIEAREKAATPAYGLVENNKADLWERAGMVDPGYWFCRVCHWTPGARSPEEVPHKPDCPVPNVLYLLAQLKEAREKLGEWFETTIVLDNQPERNRLIELKCETYLCILKGGD